MKTVGEFLTYALIAVFAQNLVFTGAGPFGMVKRCLLKPKDIVGMSAYVSVFSLLASLTVLPFDYLAPLWSSPLMVRSALLIAAVVLWYLIFAAIVPHIGKLRGSADMLPSAALNGAVMVMPLLLDLRAVSDPVRVCGLAVGSGIGFGAAVWLLSCGMRRADNPDMPESFRGTPILLIYVGLLSLAFSAFGGI